MLQQQIEEEILSAVRNGDVEQVLRMLDEIYDQYFHNEILLKEERNRVFNIRDADDCSLLHVASQRGHYSIIDALLRQGFPVDAINGASTTALHKAVEAGDFVCVKGLVRYGALVLPDANGNTPIDIARAHSFVEICSFFDSYSRTKSNEIDKTVVLVNPSVHPKRIVVGICGATCSGKSTLTRALVKHFECKEPYHHMDSYWKEFNLMPREKGFVNGESPECLQMDLFIDDLKKRRGEGEDRILFVDGFLLLHHPEVRDMLDLKIFLKISEEGCKRRRKARNPGTSKAYYENVIWPSYLKYNAPFINLPAGHMDANTKTLVLDGERKVDEVLKDTIMFISKYLD